MPVQTVIKTRRDTAANWASTNPILAAGEEGYETDTQFSKIGNGTSTYTNLPYTSAGYAVSAGSASSSSTSGLATNSLNQWLYVKNSTGSTIAKGTPVYVSGANGTNILISKASNATEATSSKTLGLTYASMTNNAVNYVVTEGLVSNGINTSAATLGDPVWLGVDGALLFGVANKPVAPAHMVSLGFVTRVHATNGEIFVKVQNGFELEELHNVLIVDEQDGDILAYDEASGLWKNSAGGFAPTSNPTFTTGSVTETLTAQNLYAFSLNDGLSIMSDGVIQYFSVDDKMMFVGTSTLDGIVFTLEEQTSAFSVRLSYGSEHSATVSDWANAHYDTATSETANWMLGEIKVITANELAALDGATENIQAQINAKAPLVSPTFTGTVDLSSATVVGLPAGETISPFLLMGA